MVYSVWYTGSGILSKVYFTLGFEPGGMQEAHLDPLKIW